MSQESRQIELTEQTQQLLQGPLKHVRSAALAAALLPLASVVATPAAAQSAACASGGISGYVWSDTNNNGVQDPGEPGVEGAVVSLDTTYVTATDSQGFYCFTVGADTYTIAVQIPPGTQPSPTNAGSDDYMDSDGASNGLGDSVAMTSFDTDGEGVPDFGFYASPVAQPGTGTLGYWKTHPEAWPVATITVGGVTYTRDEAIGVLDRTGKDRTLAMFGQLVPAMLNVRAGNDGSCVESTIDAADKWMAMYGPIGRNVAASSFAWKVGEPLHRQLDNYNNGMLCAPHRD